MALAVVGAGFRRTGTNSLKVALEMLTLGPCHHMFEVLNDLEQLPFWQATAHGELPDWDQVFTAYSAAVDWPSARYWRGSGDDRSGTLADLRRRRGVAAVMPISRSAGSQERFCTHQLDGRVSDPDNHAIDNRPRSRQNIAPNKTVSRSDDPRHAYGNCV